jgi:hypothetical protein
MRSFSPASGELLNTSAECYHTISLKVDRALDVFSAPTLPITGTKREHNAAPTVRAQGIPITERDPAPSLRSTLTRECCQYGAEPQRRACKQELRIVW